MKKPKVTREDAIKLAILLYETNLECYKCSLYAIDKWKSRFIKNEIKLAKRELEGWRIA